MIEKMSVGDRIYLHKRKFPLTVKSIFDEFEQLGEHDKDTYRRLLAKSQYSRWYNGSLAIAQSNHGKQYVIIKDIRCSNQDKLVAIDLSSHNHCKVVGLGTLWR